MELLPTEIRIGNWIEDWTDIKNGSIQRQIDLDDFAMMANYERSGNHPLPFKPIPLTEEWLLKFGFKLNKLGNLCKYIETKENGSRFITFKYSNYYKNWYIYLEHNPPCQYLHQLQNIIFVLTGEELEVKL